MTHEKRLPRTELRRLERQKQKMKKRVAMTEEELREKIEVLYAEKYQADAERIRKDERKLIEIELRQKFGFGDKRINKLFEGVRND